jgi:CRP-like cAMP-binding protein
MATSIAQQEALFRQCIDKNEIDRAVSVLCNMAVDCARGGQFDKADAYRDLLYEVDSDALVAIMKVNEIIETEKRRAKHPSPRHSWPDFFKILSKDEAKAFFNALEQKTVQDDTFVLRQGKPNDRLYLVENGLLKMIFQNRDQEGLIHQLRHGDIFGADTFFSVNVCTSSVVSMTTAHLKYLDRHRLDHLEQTFPVIAQSLERICGSSKPISDLLKEKQMDRRASKRIHLNQKVAVQILTEESRHPMQRTLYAELWDISKHGLCFHLESKNTAAIRRLIGRSLGVRINLEVDDQFKAAAVTGSVQGVQNHHRHHFSVHMKLNPPFSDGAMATLERVAGLKQ